MFKVQVLATFKARAGKEQALKTVLAELAQKAKHDPGCLSFDLLQSLTDDSVFMFIELWDSIKQHDEHMQMPYVPAFRARREPLMEGEATISRWKVL